MTTGVMSCIDCARSTPPINLFLKQVRGDALPTSFHVDINAMLFLPAE